MKNCFACGWRDAVLVDEEGDHLCAKCSEPVPEPPEECDESVGSVERAARVIGRFEGGLTMAELCEHYGVPLDELHRRNLVSSAVSRATKMGMLVARGPRMHRTYLIRAGRQEAA